jgi:thiaminase/transcriptional activator TenA
MREMADRLADRAGPDEVAAMGEAYITSLRFELRFWEMAYTLEHWTA